MVCSHAYGWDAIKIVCALVHKLTRIDKIYEHQETAEVDLGTSARACVPHGVRLILMKEYIEPARFHYSKANGHSQVTMSIGTLEGLVIIEGPLSHKGKNSGIEGYRYRDPFDLAGFYFLGLSTGKSGEE